MNKLPDKLAAKRDEYIQDCGLTLGTMSANILSTGYDAGASEVLAMAEKLAEALRIVDQDLRDIRPIDVVVLEALADWEAWKGKG